MNRYELHQALEDAREEGRKLGLAEASQNYVPVKYGPAGQPIAQVTAPGAKHRCTVALTRAEHHDACELRVMLYIGSKYYTAYQMIDREIFMHERKAIDKHLLNWFEGAKRALFEEFWKDVETTWPKNVQNIY